MLKVLVLLLSTVLWVFSVAGCDKDERDRGGGDTETLNKWDTGADLDIDADGDTDNDTDGDTDTDGDGDGDIDADIDADGDTDSDTRTTGTPDKDTGAASACPAGALGARLGKKRLMLGGLLEDESFSKEPFDIRYVYLAGNVPTGGPCADCSTNCRVDGASCANTAGCSWWGCWQWDQEPPGRYVADFVSETVKGGAVPMISYYIWFSVAGSIEGDAEIAKLTDGDRVSAYLADYRFMLEVIDQTTKKFSIVHLEPDLWAYGNHVNSDPTKIPVSLSAASAPECAGLGNHLAGFGKCMVAIARAVAPNVLIAFHASGWAEGHDVMNNKNSSLDLEAHARSTAKFLDAIGASDGDLLAVDMSDRDAGFDGDWWDPTNATLPNFTQALSWIKYLGDAMSLPTLWWQVPYGHKGMENDCDRYEDVRVDYFFDHPEEFSAAGCLGIAFGAGARCMTSAESDDGHFLSRAGAYYDGTPPSLCQ